MVLSWRISNRPKKSLDRVKVVLCLRKRALASYHGCFHPSSRLVAQTGLLLLMVSVTLVEQEVGLVQDGADFVVQTKGVALSLTLVRT